MGEPSFEQQVLGALRLTQELRSSVSFVVKKLSDGRGDTKEHIEKSGDFLEDFGKGLLAINKSVGELESVSKGMQLVGGPIPLGNSRLLTLDPSLDKTSLYAQLIHSYKWASKMHDQSQHVTLLLQQNQLKRSNINSGLSAKRPRRLPTSAHNIPSATVDALVQKVDKLFPTMTVSLSHPFGLPAVLVVTVGRTMKAIIILRGLLIEYVSIRGLTEVLELADGKMDIWGKSKHEVFQKITDHANAATLYYMVLPLPDQLILRNYFTWLNSYINLFSTPCQRCGQILQNNLPPTWRDFRGYVPYHEACKP